MNFKKKYFFGGVIIFLLLLIFSIIFLFNKKPAKKETPSSEKSQEEVLPTIESSVKVDFQSIKKGEAVLKVFNSPKKTDSIEFEISYFVKNNDVNEGDEGLIEQGVIGKCYQEKDFWSCGQGESSANRKIVFGTCSSGVCRYHNIVGQVNLTLKFTGSYGEKIFNKKYDL